MLIGEICKKTSLTKDTIRFYEKKGLLQVGRTASEFNNYKNYTLEHVQRLLLIKRAKRFGFTLNEIAELLKLFDLKSASCTTMQKKIDEKLSDIDKRIEELKEMKRLILLGIQQTQTQCLSKTKEDNCKLLE